MYYEKEFEGVNPDWTHGKNASEREGSEGYDTPSHPSVIQGKDFG